MEPAMHEKYNRAEYLVPVATKNFWRTVSALHGMLTVADRDAYRQGYLDALEDPEGTAEVVRARIKSTFYRLGVQTHQDTLAPGVREALKGLGWV